MSHAWKPERPLYYSMAETHGDVACFFNENPTHPKKIGRNTVIGWGSFIDCVGQITIEDFVFFGHRVMILTGSHDVEKFDMERQDSVRIGFVTIKRGAWIASDVTVLPNVTIGEHSVVGAGSLVTKDVPAFEVWAGRPARKIRDIVARPT